MVFLVDADSETVARAVVAVVTAATRALLARVVRQRGILGLDKVLG